MGAAVDQVVAAAGADEVVAAAGAHDVVAAADVDDVVTGRATAHVAAEPASCRPEPTELRHGLPLGFGAHGPVAGTSVEVDLEPGDGLLLYSDGVTEARDPDGNPFGEERLADLLTREHRANARPHEMVRRLVHAVLDHTAGRLRDDATLLYLRWDPPR